MAQDEFEGALPLVPAERPGVAESETTPDAGGVSGGDPTQLVLFQSILRLMQARAVYQVGLALTLKYPTEDDFQALLRSPEFIEAMTAFNAVRQDMIAAGLQAPDQFDGALADHASQAYESLEVLAALLEIAPEDLVSVLVR